MFNIQFAITSFSAESLTTTSLAYEIDIRQKINQQQHLRRDHIESIGFFGLALLDKLKRIGTARDHREDEE
jgi:hypothetical protein